MKKSKATRVKFYSLVIPILLITSGLCSCNFETESEIDDLAAPSRLVLNGLIYTNRDTNAIRFSESKSIFGKENARPAVKYDDYWYLDPKVILLTDVNISIYKNNLLQESLYCDPKDSIFYYIDQLKAGDGVRIEAIEKNRKIFSSFTVPVDPVILSIDTISFYKNPSSSYYYSPYGQMLRLLIKIKDQPGVKNYYRLFVDSYTDAQIDPEYAKEKNSPEVMYYSNSMFFTEDPVITNGKPREYDYFGYNIIGYEQNQFSVFTDEMFNGKEYSLNVYVPVPSQLVGNDSITHYTYYYPYFTGESDEITGIKQTLKVRLQAINEELYLYYLSLQKSIYSSSNQIEPVKIFNNIKGGLGIWGVVNERTMTVYEKDTVYVK